MSKLKALMETRPELSQSTQKNLPSPSGCGEHGWAVAEIESAIDTVREQYRALFDELHAEVKRAYAIGQKRGTQQLWEELRLTHRLPQVSACEALDLATRYLLNAISALQEEKQPVDGPRKLIGLKRHRTTVDHEEADLDH